MGISGLSTLAGAIGSAAKFYGKSKTAYAKGIEKFNKSYKRYKKFGIDKYIPDLNDFYEPPEKYSIKNAKQLQKAQYQLTELGEKLKADIKATYDVRIKELENTYGENAAKTKIGSFKDYFKEPKTPTLNTLKSIEGAEKKIRLAGEFGEEYTKLKRIYGGYKKYGIGYIADFEDFFQKPKRVTEGTIRRMRETENKIRATGEQAKREYDSDIIITNLKVAMDGYIAGTNEWTIECMEKSAKIVNQIIDDAVDKHGIYYVAQTIKNFAGNIYDEIRRLIRAIYDEEYRNIYAGTKRWVNYKKGASSYERGLRELASKFDVEVDTILLKTMGGNVR